MTIEQLVSISFLIIVILGGGGLFLLRFLLSREANKQYNYQIYRITIPQFASKPGAESPQPHFKERLTDIENLFSVLASQKAEHGIKSFFYGRHDQLSFEVVSHDGLIHFYAALPDPIADFVMQQIHAVYPHAQFDRVTDYNIFEPTSVIVGSYLTFRRQFIFPIKTYKLFEGDPLEALTTALGKMPEHSGAAIQFTIRSAQPQWHAAGRKLASDAEKLGSLSAALKKTSSGGLLGKAGTALSAIGSILGSSLQPTKKNDDIPKAKILSPRDAETIKGIEEKISKGGLDVNIRIVVSAPDATTADRSLRNIVDSFGQFNIYEYGNAFKATALESKEHLIQSFIYRYFNEHARMVMNAEEFATIFHLPEQVKTPHVRWLKAKQVPPPTDLPQEGIVLGMSEYRNESIEIRIKDSDRRRHVYMIGQTGTGKSNMMENMAIQDIRRGKGVCVIDPHGDLVEKIVSQVPKERINDVIIFDPSDTSRPVALNMLEYDNPEQKTFVINEMINIFDKLYDLKTTGGPMFEQYMRNAMLLIMDDPESGSTLLEIPKVMADEQFRKMKLSKTVNPVVRDFWTKEAQKAGGEAALANMVPYITSKLTQFVANDIMRPIIAQQKSAFNFREIMDKQKILLINLSKGKIGDMSSALLGMICVGKLLMAALSRVDIADESQRNDFYLYIDEFQNYVSDSIAVILSEARKYRLNLTVAHQYIAQLVSKGDTKVKDAVFGNVGTVIAFRIGVDDAETIAQQYAPVVNEYDLMNVEKFHCYVRLLIDNQNPPAFSCKPLPPQQGNPDIARIARDISRATYGRPREVVESEILERTKIAPVTPSPLPPLA